jgi:hypothetical protein
MNIKKQKPGSLLISTSQILVESKLAVDPVEIVRTIHSYGVVVSA